MARRSDSPKARTKNEGTRRRPGSKEAQKKPKRPRRSGAMEQLGATPMKARSARMLARAPRIIFISLIVIFTLAGLRSTFLPSTPTIENEVTGPPVDYSEQEFAEGFTRAYLSYSPNLEARQASLIEYLPDGADPDAGFTPPANQTQKVTDIALSQVEEMVQGGRIYTMAVDVSTQRDPIYLAVPVARSEDDGGLFLNGFPAIVGAPLTNPSELATNATGLQVEDPVLIEVVERTLTNYLATNASNLRADLTPEAVVTLPTAPLNVDNAEIPVWAGDETSGAVVMTVNASNGMGGSYRLTYEVGVEPAEPGWKVNFIQVAPEDS